MTIGSELDKQIYKEGEPTWGCKSGVLDVEDVKQTLNKVDKRLEKWFNKWHRKVVTGRCIIELKQMYKEEFGEFK